MFEMDSDQAEKLDRKKIILATYKKALTKIRKYIKWLIVDISKICNYIQTVVHYFFLV